MNNVPPRDQDAFVQVAWNFLIGFISNYDHSFRPQPDFSPIPANNNRRLTLWANKRDIVVDKDIEGKLRIRETVNDEAGTRAYISFFSKRCLEAHLKGVAKYYYRSAVGKCPSTGYGGTAKQALRLSQKPHNNQVLVDKAREFGITDKRQSNPNYRQILLTLDIDAHQPHQEPDLQATAHYLHQKWFPGAYLEPSKRGYHIYIKIYFHKSYSYEYVRKIMRHYNGLINADLELQSWTIRKLENFSGNPTFWGRTPEGDSFISCRGSAMAIPHFPEGWQSLHEFAASGYHDFEAIRRTVEQDLLQEEHEEDHVPEVVHEAETCHEKDFGRESHELKDLAMEPDGFVRKMMLVSQLFRDNNGPVGPEVCLRRYKDLGLASADGDDGERSRVFQHLCDHYSKTFRPASRLKPLTKADWDGVKDSYLSDSRFTGATWSKGDGECRTLSTETLGLIHWLLLNNPCSTPAHTPLHSTYVKNSDPLPGQPSCSSLGRSALQAYSKAIRSRSLHKDEITASMKHLTQQNLVEQVARPVFGTNRINRCATWLVYPLSSPTVNQNPMEAA